MLLAIVMAHAAVMWLMTKATKESDPPTVVSVMIGRFYNDTIDGGQSRTALPRLLKLRLQSIPVAFSDRTPPAVDWVGAPPPRPRAVATAPQLEPSASHSLRTYARRAGLAPGEGAAVVLRVEVLASGGTGQVQIDVSSGRASVDAAAIAYARTQRWKPGSSNGEPQSVWIRWGIYLRG